MRSGWHVALWTLAAATVMLPARGYALDNDISLRGLGRPRALEGEALNDDPAVQRYRRLSTDLVLAMAPRALQPAETLGVSGFEFSLVSTTTAIREGGDHWRGQPGSPVLEGGMRGGKVPSQLWTPTLHIRKGLPMSTEVGINATYLFSSEMFMLGGEVKLAIHESYFRWLPSLAARAAFGRLFGSTDLDIVTGEVGGILSLPIGVGGMVQVTPFVGYGMLFAHVNSQVIDETPYSVTDPINDQRGGPDGSLYNFPTINWYDNKFNRGLLGIRFNVAMIEVLYELDVTLLRSGKNKVQSHSFKLGFDV